MSTRTVRLHDVTNRHSADDEVPDWSPDGTKLVFDSFTNATGDNIYTIRPDGSGLQPVTSDNGNTLASWLPHGRQIVFLKASPHLQVFTMNADGTELAQITSYEGDVLRPAWQPLTPARVTHTSVTAGAASVVYGTDTSFTATVAGAGPTPTGPIQFSIDGDSDGDPRMLDSHGSATQARTSCWTSATSSPRHTAVTPAGAGARPTRRSRSVRRRRRSRWSRHPIQCR